ncbi:hypothetical protein KAW18_12800 [candidate division WOR-3 bacterium]|nr:hypothetical protein [candidate division WOR-3 bacterium]
MRKIGFGWYSLPEEVRNKLTNISTGFYTLKDNGMWIPSPAGYEPEAIAILRVHNCLSYDVFIPTIINMMQEGILTAVFPVGMKIVDIVFYQFDKSNPFHVNAYLRAGLKSSMERLSKL